MSNQFGLMLSLIFVCLFIVLSGEVICYQQASATAMAQTEQFAIYLENNGYDERYIQDFEYQSPFSEVIVNRKQENGYTKFYISTKLYYKPLSSIFPMFKGYIDSNMVVYRKE